MAEQEDTVGQELLDNRESVYGDRVDNMIRVAQMWSGILGFEVQPHHVPLMFVAYKTYRASITPDYSDNIDDLDGYAIMFREVVDAQGGMVQAKSVADYLEKKHPLEQAAQAHLDEQERLHEEKAYGQSMGREDNKLPREEDLRRKISKEFDSLSASLRSNAVNAATAARLAEAHYAPIIRDLCQLNSELTWTLAQDDLEQ